MEQVLHYVYLMIGSPGERKISFAVFGQGERSDSIHSSTTTISQMDLSGAGDSAKGRCSQIEVDGMSCPLAR